jgi:hypothetical protein
VPIWAGLVTPAGRPRNDPDQGGPRSGVGRVLTEIPQGICADMDGWRLRDGGFEAYLSLSRPGALSDLPGASGRP